LKNEFRVKVCKHTDGRIIINYNQIESPKFHPIVDECRGLCLDKNYDLVGRSFSRFYNLGENPKENFQFENSIATEKLDGSLCVIGTYEDNVYFNTRGSFGDTQVGAYPITFQELMQLAVPNYKDLFSQLPNLTFVGEICSKYNRVVIPYDEPEFFLLSIFDGENELEHDKVLEIASELGLKTPACTTLKDKKEVVKYVESKNGKEFEGLVLRSNGQRIKVKNSIYVKLHHTFSNNAAVHPNNLVPIVLAGEDAEVIAYFPEFTEEVNAVKQVLQTTYNELDNLYFCFGGEKNQKKFALAVKDHPLSGILFNARKYGKSLKEVWQESERILIDYVKEKM
jgi:hypothetical protein